MTMGTTFSERWRELLAEPAPAPALTQEEVEVCVECPLCGTSTGERCPHPLSRFRVALGWALRLQAEQMGEGIGVGGAER